MKRHLRALLSDKKMARDFAEHGLQTVRARHTCAHRVDELISILRELDTPAITPRDRAKPMPGSPAALTSQVVAT
jgi:spore maturation protein CgeB